MTQIAELAARVQISTAGKRPYYHPITSVAHSARWQKAQKSWSFSQITRGTRERRWWRCGSRCRCPKSCHAGGDVHGGGTTMRARAIVLAVALVLAPLGAEAADLVVWWTEGFYPEEDAAVAELVAAFEDQTGTKVELVPIRPDAEAEVKAAVAAGQPPDFLGGLGGTGTSLTSGPTRIGSSTSTKPSVLFGSCSTRICWRMPRCSTGAPAARPLRAADGAHYPPHPRLAEPLGAGGLHPAISPRSGRRSGRSGATGSSPQYAKPGPRRHLGRGAADVARLGRHGPCARPVPLGPHPCLATARWVESRRGASNPRHARPGARALHCNLH